LFFPVVFFFCFGIKRIFISRSVYQSKLGLIFDFKAKLGLYYRWQRFYVTCIYPFLVDSMSKAKAKPKPKTAEEQKKKKAYYSKKEKKAKEVKK